MRPPSRSRGAIPIEVGVYRQGERIPRRPLTAFAEFDLSRRHARNRHYLIRSLIFIDLIALLSTGLP